MSSKNHQLSVAEATSPEADDGSVFDQLLAAHRNPGWPLGHVIATCTDDRHPTLTGRIRVRYEDGRGHVHETWIATLNGLPVRVADRLLVLRLPEEPDPIAIGVVDGFRCRPETPKRIAQVLEVKGDETLQVNAENGQPLLQITHNQQGPVVRLLQVDTQVDLPGKLRIGASAIELCAHAGSVRVDASDDVEIVGEAIHLN
jgi:hypothetical protein